MTSTFSLQRRLLIRTLSVVLVAGLATAIFIWFEAQHEVDELLDAHLAQSAALLVVQQNTFSDDETSIPEPPMLHKYGHRVAYQVFENNALIMHSPNVDHAPMAPHLKGFDTLRFADGKYWRVFATHGRHADIQIYVAERIDTRNEILYAVLRGFLLPLCLALPLLLIGLWWNVRRGLHPLQRLRQLLIQRDTQNYAPVHLNDIPQELAPMLAALNDLLKRLGERMQTERRFTADAAHELRTPIAAIRAQAQVALGAGAQDDNARQQALQNTINGCDRATRVIEQLLTLARVEAPQDLIAETFRLDHIAQQVMADLTPQALLRHQNLELHAPQAVTVQGQSTLWHILLRNLIDNALRYSPNASTVRLSIQYTANQHTQLVLEDSGPGLSAPNMARLGERFFRVLGTSATGSGLGWSIVRHIATLQNIDVELATSPDLGGLMVRLTFQAQATT